MDPILSQEKMLFFMLAGSCDLSRSIKRRCLLMTLWVRHRFTVALSTEVRNRPHTPIDVPSRWNSELFPCSPVNPFLTT